MPTRPTPDQGPAADGGGSGFTAGLEGARDVASRRFEGRVTGLPQSAMVSGMTITAST